MYSYKWDEATGGLLLDSAPLSFSKEPRPVYYQELDILGFDKHWNYEKNDAFPYMWAEANSYWYRGHKVAQTRGGSLYTAPELILLEEPEPEGKALRFVDIGGMVEKNRELMEQLVQDTIKKVYNTYVHYKDKADIFYVAFSGGKDSVVLLDIVRRALPSDDFIVIFGNTDMEFQDTLLFVDETREYCKRFGITFYEAKAPYSSKTSWRHFGPPSRRVRWCCSVHKTAPVVNKIRKLYGKQCRSVMITGVRADESASRADYDEFSMGKKVTGQYSFHPLLEWASSEVFLYTYSLCLPINPLYKRGFNRVGCIMCPNSSEKHEYLKQAQYPKEIEPFCELITSNTRKDMSGENRETFLNTGGWKARLSGRELRVKEEERVVVEEKKNATHIIVRNLKADWKTWYKTIGDLIDEHPVYNMEFKGVWRVCKFVELTTNESVFVIDKKENSKNHIEFIYLFKSVLIKSQYCIRCLGCVAECPFGNIVMNEDTFDISDSCIRCHACLRIRYACYYYDSIRGSMNMRKLKGINRYLSVGVEAQSIVRYFQDSSFEPGNRKTDVMFGFLNDAGVTSRRQITKFGEIVKHIGLENDSIWALMICNLVYTPAFGWYLKNVPFNEQYTENMLSIDMGDAATNKAKLEFWNGFKTILHTNEAFKRIGIGVPDVTEKEYITGEIRRSMNYIVRKPWTSPDPKVILYSLFKFAEACGDYYAFTLSRLLNHDIESDGVSPTQIFGIGREEMQGLLIGLGVNYPEFIRVTFTHDLDNINLEREKTSHDVLSLF